MPTALANIRLHFHGNSNSNSMNIVVLCNISE